jgi:prophage maintenance system killer protein
LEENLLHSFFEKIETKKNMNGFDFIADMLSTLIVNQALPNANHRTTLYFVGALLTHNSFVIDTELHADVIRDYFWDSKHLLKKAPKNYIEKHLDLTKIFLAKILGSAQSGRLGSILAYSLMNSFIDSSKDLGFLSDSAMNDE